MSNVGLLVWKDMKMFVNYLKEMKNNPKRLLIFVLYIGFFIYLGLRTSSDPDSSPFSGGITPHAMALFMIVLILVTNAATALKGFTNAFPMGDVNLIFTSPVSSRAILLVSYLKKMGVTIFSSIFILIIMSGFSSSGDNVLMSKIIGFLGFFLLSITFEPINFIFMKLDKYVDKKKLMIGFVMVLVLALVGVFFYVGDLFAFITSPLVHWIPLLGWTKALLVSLFGITVENVWIFLSLQAGLTFALYAIAIGLGTDYYEEVLVSSENSASFRKKAKEGKQENIFAFNLFKNKKVSIGGNASGLKAFLWKTKIERSRSSLHYLVSISTILQLIGGIGILVATKVFNDFTWMPYAANGVVAYFMFLATMGNNTSEEYEYPYFFTIPGNNTVKLLRLYQLELMNVLLGTLLLNIPMLFVDGINPLLLGLCILGLNLFYFLLFLTNLTLRIFFGNSKDLALMMPLMKVLQVAIVILPPLGSIFLVTRFTENDTAVIASIAIAYGLVMAILLVLSGLLVRRMEYHK